MGTVTVTQPTDGTTADAADLNNQINAILAEFNGGIDNDNVDSSAGISGSKLADNSLDLGAKASTWDGWLEVTDSWTYASATTITVPSDATTKYSVGDKIKLTQTTVKYFYIVGVGATTLTITGGTTYTLANAAISAISYSKVTSPLDFPQWLAYTPTYAGFSADPTYTARFSITGRNCHVKVRRTAGGTSNATNFTLTMPVTSANTSDHAFPCAAGVDNGSFTFANAVITANSTTCTVFKNGSTWTNSGTKYADFTCVYEI